MTVNAINGSLMSGLSAVDGVSFSTLSAINGQTLAVIGVPGVASAIIWADGAEHNTAADDKWELSSAALPISSGSADAHGRYYSNATLRQSHAIGANLATLSCGLRFKVPTALGTDNLIRFQDTTANNQLCFQIENTGAFRVARGNAGTVLATSSTGLITVGNWYYCEFSATINNTTGSYTAKLYNDSGTLLGTLTASSVDTQDTANASANTIDVGGTNSDTLTDDFWLDNTGALYGPLRVETLYPDGDGTLTQWAVGAGSGAEWELVDEAQNNDSTDYLGAASVNLISLCTFQDRALSGAIHAVQVTPVVARAAAVGGVQFRAVVRIGGVNYNGTTFTFTSNGFVARPHCWGTNPATGLAWNSSELAGAEFGVESIAVPVDVFCTQIVLELVTAI